MIDWYIGLDTGTVPRATSHAPISTTWSKYVQSGARGPLLAHIDIENVMTCTHETDRGRRAARKAWKGG